MITTNCDICKLPVMIGFVCREAYLGTDQQGRMQWQMSNVSRKEDVHICHHCMNRILENESIVLEHNDRT